MVKNKLFKRKKSLSAICVMITGLVFLPGIINSLLCYTDFLYIKKGWTLSPVGVGNKEWLEFWSTYIVAIITLLSALLVWFSSKKERRRQNNIEIERLYMEDLKREQQILVDVVKGMDIALVYKTLTLASSENIYETREKLQIKRDEILNGQSEMEIFTDISISLEQCNDACKYHKIVKSIHDKYYKLEGTCINIINNCDEYLVKMSLTNGLNKEKQGYEDVIKIQNEIINKQQKLIENGLLQATQKMSAEKEISDLQTKINEYNYEMQYCRKKINTLEIEMNESLEMIKVLFNTLNEEKPNFVNACKDYINYKKSKIKEIIDTGEVNFACQEVK